MLLHGSGEAEIEFNFWRAGKISSITRPFEGVMPNLERLYTESESEFTRNRLKAFMSPEFCDACKGRRLKPEILAVTPGRSTQRAPSAARPQAATTSANPGPVHHGCLRRCRWTRRMIFLPG